MIASDHAWFNGHVTERRAADPSVASNTLHLGVGVFDGIMAYWNSGHWYVHRAKEHLDRFTTGAARMDLALRWTPDDILTGIHELLDTLPRRTHYIRPIAYRTGPEVFFHTETDTVSACVFAVPVGRDADEPYSCQLSPVRRLPSQAIPATWKISGAYANSYLAEQAARRAGYDTGLMLDMAGNIAEASASNVFFVTGDGRLVTPRLNGDVFAGITRALVIGLAGQHGTPVVERTIAPAELTGFDAAFLCATLAEIRPINRLGDQYYASATHPVVERIVKDFRAIVHQ